MVIKKKKKEMVAEGRVFASLGMLRFRDPNSFVAGNLSSCLEQWDQISVSYKQRDFVLAIVRDGVDVFDFFTPFNGTFEGKTYCSDLPPRMYFPNSVSCHPFKEFISATIEERICNGSIDVVGCVGEVEPPHLVMPITVEPSKPRMCHDERFINCWIKDCPFKLDYLTDLCRYVYPGHYQTTFATKAVMIISASILAVIPSLVLSGKVGFLRTPLSRLNGKLALLCTILLAWPLPISLDRLEFLVLSILMTGMSVSCVYDHRLAVCASSQTINWLRWRLSLPASSLYHLDTLLASRRAF